MQQILCYKVITIIWHHYAHPISSFYNHFASCHVHMYVNARVLHNPHSELKVSTIICRQITGTVQASSIKLTPQCVGTTGTYFRMQKLCNNSQDNNEDITRERDE